MADTPPEIRLFVAAYEEGSFTAAAAREGATQSGVSQHIRKLEARFGVPLFLREGGRTAPTPAGDSYYWRCIELLRAFDGAAAALRAFSQGFDGEIRVGLMPTLTRCALGPALAGFLDQHPNLSIRVVEAYSASLIRQVRQGELDFAVVPDFPATAGLRARAFAETPEVLVGRPDCLQRNSGLGARGPLKLVLPGRANTRRQTIETYCATAGVPIARQLELDSMLATLDLVATTDWVAVLPGVMMAGAGDAARFALHRLDAPPLSLRLVAIEPLRRELPPAADAFRQALAAAAAAADRAWASTPPPAPAGPAPH